MAKIFNRDNDYRERNIDDYQVHHDRPVVIEERERGGWGWLTTLLALALIAVVLWATGILEVNLQGSTEGDSLQGGGQIELSPPDGNLDVNPNNPL